MGADFVKLAPGFILGPRGGQKWIPLMQVSLIFIIFRCFFDFFFQILVFSKSGLFQNPGRKKMVFDILLSRKYGVNDPSGISHFCLNSKWHFFDIFSQFLPKNGLGVFLTSKKYGGNVP